MPFPSQFIIPFVYNKKEHIQCCWQRTIAEKLPYEEKHWLQYGIDYTVSDIGKQDTGGTLTIIKTIPPEAKQIVIRRVTPKTQEVDLHNGARLPAELIETIGDKATMQVQEITEQTISVDDKNEMQRTTNEAIKDATTALWGTLNKDFQTALEVEKQTRIHRDLELTEICQNLQQKITVLQDRLHDQQFLIEYFIQFIEYIENELGLLDSAFPLTVEGGNYLVTENNDYLVAA